MGIFQNDFFSVAGQKKRLANVGNTLLAAVGIKKGGVKSNTGIKPVDTALSAVASNPFITAGVVASAAAPTAAKAAASAVVSGAGKAFSQATLGQKAAVLVSAPVIAGAVSSNPALIGKAASAPGALANFGSNIGSLSKDPSLQNLATVAKENPVIAGAAAAAGLLAVGAAGRGVASIAATALNTSAIKESTKATQGVVMTNEPVKNSPSVAGVSALAAPVANSENKTPILPASRVINTRSKRRKKAKESPRVSQNVRINITDDRDANDRKVYKQLRR